jgi:hypothetical protein
MRFGLFALLLLPVAEPALAERQSLGVFFQWGAFLENAPKRCFAIAEPNRSPKPQGWQPFASVGFWPGSGVRAQVHFRLSRRKRPGSAVLLRIDERTFQLYAGGANAWAPDPRGDAEIVAAMRSGIDMILETRSETGAPVRDYYQLRGAATAIDAAAVACSRRR